MGMKSGRLARAAGVGVQTLRFYEREGLIDPPPRLPSGYRVYPEDTVSRIRFIRRAQELGFTLREIRELLTLRAYAGADCSDIRSVANARLHDVERRIADLTAMRAALGELLDACTGHAPVDECVILESLDRA